jgi:hypothetical protein
MIFLEFLHRGRISAVDLTQQVFGLVLELVEIGADGKTTVGHDEPP